MSSRLNLTARPLLNHQRWPQGTAQGKIQRVHRHRRHCSRPAPQQRTGSLRHQVPSSRRRWASIKYLQQSRPRWPRQSLSLSLPHHWRRSHQERQRRHRCRQLLERRVGIAMSGDSRALRCPEVRRPLCLHRPCQSCVVYPQADAQMRPIQLPLSKALLPLPRSRQSAQSMTTRT